MIENQMIKTEDRNLLCLMHLSQLLNYVTGFGGLIAPLIIWVIKKDMIKDLDNQGKEIINFQINLLLAIIICVPLCFVMIGFLLLPIVMLLGIIYPIKEAIKARDGNPIKYPLAIHFLY